MNYTHTAELSGDGWKLIVETVMQEVTSEHPTSDPHWRYTDAQGHEHRYDGGYPTLRYVIAAQHWCDGTEGLFAHDPHMAVDEDHYECRECGEVVEPGTLPPGYVQRIPVGRSATLTVRTLRGGMEVTERLSLTEDEVDRFHQCGGDEAAVNAVVVELSASVPEGRRHVALIASR